MQATPQSPQFASSTWTLAQLAPHILKPPAHPQVPPLQMKPFMQLMVQLPQ
jgi:hypothetical protein